MAPLISSREAWEGRTPDRSYAVKQRDFQQRRFSLCPQRSWFLHHLRFFPADFGQHMLGVRLQGCGPGSGVEGRLQVSAERPGQT